MQNVVITPNFSTSICLKIAYQFVNFAKLTHKLAKIILVSLCHPSGCLFL